MLLDILLIGCQTISTHRTSLIIRLEMVHTGKSIRDNLRFISRIFLRANTTDRVVLAQLNKTEIEVTSCKFPILPPSRTSFDTSEYVYLRCVHSQIVSSFRFGITFVSANSVIFFHSELETVSKS